MTITDAELPDGWGGLTAEQVSGFAAELALELRPLHRLYGVPMQAVAVSDASDDALFRHTDEPDLFSVVHLTWTGKQEQGHWPVVTFTGTFAQFRDFAAAF